MTTLSVGIRRRVDDKEDRPDSVAPRNTRRGRWQVVAEVPQDGSLTAARYRELIEFDLEALIQLDRKAYGEQLGRWLFSGGIGQAFGDALGRAISSRERLRVLLEVEAEELRSVHWERLCAPLDGGAHFLATSQRTTYAQYVSNFSSRRFTPIGNLDLRALVVAVRPDNLADKKLSDFDLKVTFDGVFKSLSSLRFQGGAPAVKLGNTHEPNGRPGTLDALRPGTSCLALQFGHFQRFITARMVRYIRPLGRGGLNHGGVANDVGRGALAEGLGLNLFAQECYQVLAGGTPSGTAPLW